MNRSQAGLATKSSVTSLEILQKGLFSLPMSFLKKHFAVENPKPKQLQV